MSFYRNLLIGFATLVFTMPLLAEDQAAQANNPQAPILAKSIELTENGVKVTDPAPPAPPAPAETAKTAADAAKSNATTTPPVANEAKVDLNKASVNDLMKVKGL